MVGENVKLPCFWEQYEQDMAKIMEKLKKEFPRIYPYEEDAVRFWYAQYYYAAKEECISYYCPVLAKDADGGKEAMYRIKQRDGDVIKICEELAESLLERGMTGMGLTSE